MPAEPRTLLGHTQLLPEQNRGWVGTHRQPLPLARTRHCSTHGFWRAGERLWLDLDQEGQDGVEKALAQPQDQQPVQQRGQGGGGRVVGDDAASHLLHRTLQR